MPIARRSSQASLEAHDGKGVHRAASGEYELDLPMISAPPRSEMKLQAARAIPVDVPLPREAPKSYRSGQMPGVRPADSHTPDSGRMLDDSFDDAPLAIALELQAPPSGHIPLQTMAGGEIALPAMWAKSGSAGHRPLDSKPGIVAFAGYGMPPAKLLAMPAYAMRVIVRRHALRGDLKIARWRRLPQRDIELYEAALACADEAAVTKGLALAASTFAGAVSAIVAAVAFLF